MPTPHIAWQTWLVFVLMVANFAVISAMEDSSGFTLSPETYFVLKVLAFAIPLATNQLKSIGGPPPVGKTTTTPPAP